MIELEGCWRKTYPAVDMEFLIVCGFTDRVTSYRKCPKMIRLHVMYGLLIAKIIASIMR